MTAKEWSDTFYAALKKAGQGESPVRFQVEELVQKAMRDMRNRCAEAAKSSKINDEGAFDFACDAAAGAIMKIPV